MRAFAGYRVKALSLFTHPLHLGFGGRAVSQPEYIGMEWYEEYARRTATDGEEGRLVSLHRFEESWTSWEMHPAGDEVVVCLEGLMTLHQDLTDGSKQSVELGAGDYAINPSCTWHTADCSGPVLALFITVGQGTMHRPR